MARWWFLRVLLNSSSFSATLLSISWRTWHSYLHISTMIALTLLVSLLSLSVSSLPAPDGVVGHGGHRGDVYDERPDPFHFEYGVHDDKYHTDFSEQRSGDESGSMKGEYTVALPDGRVQHVIYHADGGYGGTIMEVKYSGEAHHPDYHAGGHGGHV